MRVPMPADVCRHLFAAALLTTIAGPVGAQQSPAPTPTTTILATLTVKPGIDRAALLNTMPAEVRDTVQLYLDGKILQWYARSDGRGVVFLINAKSVEEAKAVTDALPLIKGNLASFEFMALGPLTPLRFLLNGPDATPKGEPDR